VPYITENQLKAAVAASQGASGPEALGPHWHSVIGRANRMAYNALRSALFDRGFTAAEIDAWDAAADWNERLGVCQACWSVSKSSEDRGEAFRREWTDLLKELAGLTIVDGDTATNPTGDGTRVSSGSYTTTTDIHTIDDVL
jgi:hypothetical protein